MPTMCVTAPILGLVALFVLSGCSSEPPVRTQEIDHTDDKTLTGTPSPTRTTAWIEDQQSTAVNRPEDSIPGLWERVRSGFRLSIPDHPRIELERQWYQRNSEYLARIETRARPWLHYIVEQLEQRGLPSELALLPAVESAFQPFAYSPGRAAGLWQFIPSTGHHYGLKQNWWYDGRRDAAAATHAALDYLQALNKQFDGDWELALAAYNAGGGRVSRAIHKNREKGRPIDFWSLDLPRETQGYVPRLLALSSLIKEPGRFNIQLNTIPDEPYFEMVDIGGQLDLALAADMAGITIEELYQLNPGFNRWATDPEGPHRLYIPIGKVDMFTRRLADLNPDKRLRWTRYKIQNGDSLGVIARRYSSTIALLQQVNKLKSHRIRAGKHLLIPISSKNLGYYALSAKQRKEKLQNVQRDGQRITHTIQPGDTLWGIARKYKINHQKLARWNGIAPGDTLHPGQQLVIWEKNAAELASIAKSHKEQLSFNQEQRPINSISSLQYKVRRGDSLARIAQRFRVTVADLRKWNTLPGKYLQPGQRLKLYVDVTEQTL